MICLCFAAVLGRIGVDSKGCSFDLFGFVLQGAAFDLKGFSFDVLLIRCCASGSWVWFGRFAFDLHLIMRWTSVS